MTQRHRATVHVDLVGIEVELTHRLQDDSGERLVDLPEVDVVDGHARLAERDPRGRSRRRQHDDGFGSGNG